VLRGASLRPEGELQIRIHDSFADRYFAHFLCRSWNGCLALLVPLPEVFLPQRFYSVEESPDSKIPHASLKSRISCLRGETKACADTSKDCCAHLLLTRFAWAKEELLVFGCFAGLYLDDRRRFVMDTLSRRAMAHSWLFFFFMLVAPLTCPLTVRRLQLPGPS